MFILIIETLNKVWNTFKLTTANRTIPVTSLWYPSYFWTYWGLSENFSFIASEQTLQNNFFKIFVKSKRNSKFFWREFFYCVDAFNFHIPVSTSWFTLSKALRWLFCNCQTCCPTVLGSAFVILIPCRSRSLVMLEHTNIVRFFVAYSQSQSVLIVHVEDVITQDPQTFIEPQTLTDFISMKQWIVHRCNTGNLRKQQSPLPVSQSPINISIKMYKFTEELSQQKKLRLSKLMWSNNC